MLKLALSLAVSFICLFAQAQLKRFYTLDETVEFDTVHFKLKATSGSSFVRYVPSGNPLTIFGNPDLQKINPSYSVEQVKRACHVRLDLNEYKESIFGRGLTFAMSGSSTEEEGQNYWKFLFNDKQVYVLDFNFGIGSTNIDLSGISVSKLFVKSGSADVTINYQKYQPNKINMDTLSVKVDLGSLAARDLALAQAGTIITEVGFGQAILDFHHPSTRRTQIFASVGAGKLEIVLPRSTPVLIKIKDSPLCSISMPDGFEQVENYIYLNHHYDAKAENLLTFQVNVMLGKVSFVYAD